jgi:hypothetical protein
MLSADLPSRDLGTYAIIAIFGISRMRCSTQWCTAVPGSLRSRRVLCSELVKIPGLRRNTPLRFVLHRARETDGQWLVTVMTDVIVAPGERYGAPADMRHDAKRDLAIRDRAILDLQLGATGIAADV